MPALKTAVTDLYNSSKLEIAELNQYKCEEAEYSTHSVYEIWSGPVGNAAANSLITAAIGAPNRYRLIVNLNVSYCTVKTTKKNPLIAFSSQNTLSLSF